MVVVATVEDDATGLSASELAEKRRWEEQQRQAEEAQKAQKRKEVEDICALADADYKEAKAAEQVAAAKPWSETPEGERDVAVLFPGQGTQKVGMAGKLLENKIAQSMFDMAGKVLGYSLVDLCAQGPQEKLDTTLYSQPAIFVCSLAAMEIAKKEAPEMLKKVKTAAGFSLGEYSALVFGGGLSFDEGLKVVKAPDRPTREEWDAHGAWPSFLRRLVPILCGKMRRRPASSRALCTQCSNCSFGIDVGPHCMFDDLKANMWSDFQFSERCRFLSGSVASHLGS